MTREAIAKGETVEIAFANACRELGVDTTEAECDILEMPTKKTLGLFGGSPAKVRAYIEEPDVHDPVTEATQYLQSVLAAMGLPEERVGSALRASFSRFSTDEDVDALAEGVKAGLEALAKER